MSTADTDIIRVYVCSDCGNYFGSSSMGSLENSPNIAVGGSKNPGSIVSYRNRCPGCGSPREERWARLISQEDVAEARKAVSRQGATVGGTTTSK